MTFFKESFEEHTTDTPEQRVDAQVISEQIDIKIDTEIHALRSIVDDTGQDILENSKDLKPNYLYSIFDVEYRTDEHSSIYCIDGKVIPDKQFVIDGITYAKTSLQEKGAESRVEKQSDNVELSVEEKQRIADQAAQEYNAKTNPYDRALEKGIDGVKKTDNGGVSFSDTDAIYIKEDGTKCIVKIEATGNRTKDFDAANAAMGLEETPDGYVWHHVDDYNVEDGTITLELVTDEAHNASKPHSGGCAQYDAVNGPSYNPPRKGDNTNV